MEHSLTSIINLLFLEWNSAGEYVNSLSAIIYGVSIIVAPLFVLYFLHTRK